MTTIPPPLSSRIVSDCSSPLPPSSSDHSTLPPHVGEVDDDNHVPSQHHLPAVPPIRRVRRHGHCTRLPPTKFRHTLAAACVVVVASMFCALSSGSWPSRRSCVYAAADATQDGDRVSSGSPSSEDGDFSEVAASVDEHDDDSTEETTTTMIGRRLRTFIHVGVTPEGYVDFSKDNSEGDGDGGERNRWRPWEAIPLTSDNFYYLVRDCSPLLLMVHDRDCKHSHAALRTVEAVAMDIYLQDVEAGFIRKSDLGEEQEDPSSSSSWHAVRRVAYLDVKAEPSLLRKFDIRSFPSIITLSLSYPTEAEISDGKTGYAAYKRLNLLAVPYEGPHDDPVAMAQHIRWSGWGQRSLASVNASKGYAAKWDAMPTRPLIENAEGLWAFAAGPQVTLVRCREFMEFCSPEPTDDDDDEFDEGIAPEKESEKEDEYDESADFMRLAVSHRHNPSVAFVELLSECTQFLPPSFSYQPPSNCSAYTNNSGTATFPLPIVLLEGSYHDGVDYADGLVYDLVQHGTLEKFVSDVAMRPVMITFDDRSKITHIWPGEYAADMIHVALFVDEHHVKEGDEDDDGLVAITRRVAQTFFARGDTIFVVVPSYQQRIRDFFNVTADASLPCLLVTDARGKDMLRYYMDLDVASRGGNAYGDALMAFLRELYNADGPLPPSNVTSMSFQEAVVRTSSPSDPEKDFSSDTSATVRVVHTTTFDDLVMLSPNNTLVHFYAPYCGHSQQLAPRLTRLAHALHPLSIDVMKMDASAGEVLHPKVGILEFPTLYLFKAGEKEDPIKYGRPSNSMEDLIVWLMENGMDEWILEEDDDIAANGKHRGPDDTAEVRIGSSSKEDETLDEL